MKRTLSVCLILISLLTAAGCGSKSNSAAAQPEQYDLDFTTFSSTIVYSELYNIMTSPDGYRGMHLKISGIFGFYQDPETGKQYYACVIDDATACCSLALEFILEGNAKYPDDYPRVNDPITVSGYFDTYEENGMLYCQLANAKLH